MISQKSKSASFCSFPIVLQLYFQESEQFFMIIGTASVTESHAGWYTKDDFCLLPGARKTVKGFHYALVILRKWDTRSAHSYETLSSAYLQNSKIYTAT